MRYLRTNFLLAGALFAMLGCSESPESLLEDGHAAMRLMAESDAIDSGRIDDGIASLRAFVDRYPNDLNADSALFMMASLQDVMGDHREAADNYRALLRLYPDSKYRPKSLILAGHIYERTRDLTRAKACYEMLIRDFPEHEFVVGGSAQWLLDNMNAPPESWPIPFDADSLDQAPSSTGS